MILPRTLPAFILHFLKPYRWYFLGFVLASLHWAAFLSLTPYMIKLIIDRVAAMPHADAPALFAAVGVPLTVFVGMSFANSAIHRLREWCALRAIPAIKRDIRRAMFAYTSQHSHHYFQNNFAGSIANKITDMTRGVEQLTAIATDLVIPNLFAMIVACGTLALVHPTFALVLTVWAALFLTVTGLLSKRAYRYSRVTSEASSRVTGKVVDALSNITTVRLFSRFSFESRYADRFFTDVMRKDRRLQAFILKVRSFQMVTVFLMLTTMMCLCVYGRANGWVSLGDFALVVMIARGIIEAIWRLSDEFVRLYQELGTCGQALSIITPPHEVVDVADAPVIHVTKGEIAFERVTFNYGRQTPLFSDLSVTIKAGSKVGLVGFSGSGKTTFANLILRQYDIQGGAIRIDGQDIAKVTQDSLREQIALIPQDTALFHRSLFENIRYGLQDAGEEDVKRASALAHCDEFIRTLPEGYRTMVGERGIKLSGGQRQRIAIARAILKNAPILILDEATSALDSVTEQYIQQALSGLMKDRTTLVIAHRLSTLLGMDRILVFQKGQILEDGSHAELLASGGHYATLWAMQAGGFLPE